MLRPFNNVCIKGRRRGKMSVKMAEAFFPGSIDDFNSGICPVCKKEIKDEDFRDALSKKEYRISGLCQECQDKAFGV